VSCTAHQLSKLRLLTGFVAATVDGHFFDPGTVTYAPRECLTEPLSRLPESRAVHYRKDAAKYHEWVTALTVPPEAAQRGYRRFSALSAARVKVLNRVLFDAGIDLRDPRQRAGQATGGAAPMGTLSKPTALI
jgi:hypothetical protein